MIRNQEPEIQLLGIRSPRTSDLGLGLGVVVGRDQEPEIQLLGIRSGVVVIRDQEPEIQLLGIRSPITKD